MRAAEEESEKGVWFGLGALALVLAAVIVATYFAFGRTDTAGPPPAPITASPTSGPMLSSPPPTRVASSGSPSAASSSPAAPVSQSPSSAPPSSPAPAAGVPIDLDGAVVTVLPGWQMYADEVVQDGRRLIRLREVTTDTRIQAVILTTLDDDLSTACLTLMNDQGQGFTGVAESLAVTVHTAPDAEGVSCAFTGTRTSDSVPNKVEFTLLRRSSDGLTLFFRDTIPSAVPEDSPAMNQLTTIECAAADSFGVEVTACAVIPDQVDG